MRCHVRRKVRNSFFFFFLPSSSKELLYKKGRVHLQRSKEDRRDPSRFRPRQSHSSSDLTGSSVIPFLWTWD